MRRVKAQITSAAQVSQTKLTSSSDFCTSCCAGFDAPKFGEVIEVSAQRVHCRELRAPLREQLADLMPFPANLADKFVAANAKMYSACVEFSPCEEMAISNRLGHTATIHRLVAIIDSPCSLPAHRLPIPAEADSSSGLCVIDQLASVHRRDGALTKTDRRCDVSWVVLASMVIAGPVRVFDVDLCGRRLRRRLSLLRHLLSS